MEEQTTIVGRPTYMAMFDGVQDAGPIRDKLLSIGYPQDDITILLRPPGTDSALDLLSDENAAGQDSDAARLLAKAGDKLKDACTIVILHPAPDQVAAVRAALTSIGGQEFEYEPETVYTGAQSEADFAQSTVGSVGAARNAGIEGAGSTGTSGPAGKDEAEKPGQFHPSPANATSDAPSAGAGASSTAPGPGAQGTPARSEAGSDATAAATVPASDMDTAPPSAPKAPSPAPLPDTSDLKAEIRDLANKVDAVRDELEQRD